MSHAFVFAKVFAKEIKLPRLFLICGVGLNCLDMLSGEDFIDRYPNHV